MVVYFDTSAFVPLIVAEDGTSASSREIWSRASAAIATRILYVEATAAVSRRNRAQLSSGDLTPTQSNDLDSYWGETFAIDLDDQLIRQAAWCASRFGLRGFDAVHCAAAASIKGERVVAASSDRQLLDAWSELGLATFDPRC